MENKINMPVYSVHIFGFALVWLTDDVKMLHGSHGNDGLTNRGMEYHTSYTVLH